MDLEWLTTKVKKSKVAFDKKPLYTMYLRNRGGENL